MRRSPSGTATGHSWAGGPMAACSVCDADPDRALHVSRLILDTPALLARFLERQSQWQAEMVGILARRMGLDPDAGLRPALCAEAERLQPLHCATPACRRSVGRTSTTVELVRAAPGRAVPAAGRALRPVPRPRPHEDPLVPREAVSQGGMGMRWPAPDARAGHRVGGWVRRPTSRCRRGARRR
ncbi:hypothetical protein AB0G86_10370 [Streptomyces scabiei]|uniref:acyl-CoA-like ligand-binding transcription factor n=1 Tax=Streptomyces scabiei TaxID=1930 RepID=UPI0033C4C477